MSDLNMTLAFSFGILLMLTITLKMVQMMYRRVRRKVISGVGVAKWLAATGVISVADFHLIDGFLKTIF